MHQVLKTTTDAKKGTILRRNVPPQKIMKVRCPRLGKNVFAIQHLLHHAIVYTFIHYRLIMIALKFYLGSWKSDKSWCSRWYRSLGHAFTQISCLSVFLFWLAFLVLACENIIYFTVLYTYEERSEFIRCARKSVFSKHSCKRYII